MQESNKTLEQQTIEKNNEVLPDGYIRCADGKLALRTEVVFKLTPDEKNSSIVRSLEGTGYSSTNKEGTLKRVTPKFKMTGKIRRQMKRELAQLKAAEQEEVVGNCDSCGKELKKKQALSEIDHPNIYECSCGHPTLIFPKTDEHKKDDAGRQVHL